MAPEPVPTAAPPAQASSSQVAPVPSRSDPERWVDEYGDYLYRNALVRLRDPMLAEDMVQETFLAALKARDNFAGRSSEKSWLVGILKNKIVDYFRKASRETSFTDQEFLGDEDSRFYLEEGRFIGEWQADQGPCEWDNPGGSLDNAAFWKAFHECAAKLPKNISRVFVLREVDDVKSDEICAMLNISPNNLWVMLHRARLALRRCLETNWFGLQDEKS